MDVVKSSLRRLRTSLRGLLLGFAVSLSCIRACASEPDKQATIVARFDPAAAENAVREFEVVFDQTRTSFGDGLETFFAKRSIDEHDMFSREFREFREQFVLEHPDLLVGYALARTWASGREGEEIRVRMAAKLHAVLSGKWISRPLPKASTVVIVNLPEGPEPDTWEGVRPSVVTSISSSEVLDLEQARAALWHDVHVADRLGFGYLERLIRETIVYDARLTALFRGDGVSPPEPGLPDAFRTPEGVESIAMGEEPVDSKISDRYVARPAVPEPAAADGQELPRAAAPPSVSVVSSQRAPINPRAILVAVLGVATLAVGALALLRLQRLRLSMRHTDARSRPTGAQGAPASASTSTAATAPGDLQERMQAYERRIRALHSSAQKR